MPQLDPTWFASQLFWLTVIFTLFYLLLARHVLPQVQDVLETRHNRIQHDLDRAASLQADAESMREAYESALARARADAAGLLADAGEQVKANSVAQHTALDTTLQRKLQESEQAIEDAKQRMIAQLTPVAAELAAAITGRLRPERPAAAEAERAVQAVLLERG